MKTRTSDMLTYIMMSVCAIAYVLVMLLTPLRDLAFIISSFIGIMGYFLAMIIPVLLVNWIDHVVCKKKRIRRLLKEEKEVSDKRREFGKLYKDVPYYARQALIDKNIQGVKRLQLIRDYEERLESLVRQHDELSVEIKEIKNVIDLLKKEDEIDG